MKPVLFNLSPAELEQFVLSLGQPKFRAKQIAEWLGRGAPDFSVMKNLPADLRARIAETADTLPCKIVKKLESSDGQTTKFLLELNDGEQIETVLMRTTYGNSVCVSSQAGCAMGCKFCASTLLGLKRNLTANEMIAQVLIANWQLKQGQKDKRTKGQESREMSICPSDHLSFTVPNGDAAKGDVSHIVVMGTGEPLQNLDNTTQFLEYANQHLGISWRKITVSTCGIVPGIEKLTEWGRPVNLAISLHAPNDELRGRLMPINAKYPLDKVLAAAFANSEKTGRQLMIEYILLAAPKESEERREKSADNCSLEHAEQLAGLLRGHEVMVNLIPWNAVDERDFKAPSGNAAHRFQDALIAAGIHTRIRRERGSDIGSACGQLRLGKKAS
ncbi:MAG: radical SAM protein [Rickettsiales bacterium]|jgi:23S rRNA (adenine2503-C2)-methyltransferase|nr:radical SAM protein [Rickettsiales bacterium]